MYCAGSKRTRSKYRSASREILSARLPGVGRSGAFEESARISRTASANVIVLVF
jgi:hypothetical protein